MKVIISFIVAVISMTTIAQTFEFNCSFPSVAKNGSLFMTVDQLYSDNILLNYTFYTAYDEEAAFSYKGGDLEWLWDLALSADGQYIYKDKKSNLVYSMDSDGCDYGVLYLYENSGFTKGYLDIKHTCSGPELTKTYSKAICTISTK